MTAGASPLFFRFQNVRREMPQLSQNWSIVIPLVPLGLSALMLWSVLLVKKRGTAGFNPDTFPCANYTIGPGVPCNGVKVGECGESGDIRCCCTGPRMLFPNPIETVSETLGMDRRQGDALPLPPPSKNSWMLLGKGLCVDAKRHPQGRRQLQERDSYRSHIGWVGKYAWSQGGSMRGQLGQPSNSADSCEGGSMRGKVILFTGLRGHHLNTRSGHRGRRTVQT